MGPVLSFPTLQTCSLQSSVHQDPALNSEDASGYVETVDLQRAPSQSVALIEL